MPPFRSHHPAALFVAFALLVAPLAAPFAAGEARAQAPAAAKDEKAAKEPSVGQNAARARQKTCGAEWRALSVSDKAAQGPKWPQYYSKCVKRLKEQKA